jgi:hypothetical protein
MMGFPAVIFMQRFRGLLNLFVFFPRRQFYTHDRP